jgi:hypothetical protein
VERFLSGARQQAGSDFCEHAFLSRQRSTRAAFAGLKDPRGLKPTPPNRLIPSDRGFAPRESMRAISLSVTHPDLPDGLIQGFRFMRAFYVNGTAGTRSFT